MSTQSNVRELQSSSIPPAASGGNGVGGGSDDRLREVEKKLAVIESEIRHLATKADIEGKFATQSKWQIGILVTVALSLVSIIAGFVVAILRMGGG